MSQTQQIETLSPTLRRALRKPGITGLCILGGFFGLMVLWSIYAPISGAVIAAGSVAPEGATRIVQHFEGGIIDEFLVREGDQVRQGTPLLRLRDIHARSQYDILKTQMLLLDLAEDRLRAEQRGDERWIPQGALQHSAEGKEMRHIQERLFTLRRQRIREEVVIADQRIAELESNIAMLRRQNEALSKQLALIRREIEMVEPLLKQGLEPLQRLLQLQRADASTEDTLAGRNGTIERTLAQIETLKTQRVNAETNYFAEIAQQLETSAIRRAELTRRLLEAQDVLLRTTVSAPVDGIVTNLRHHTVGAVVLPGEALLQLVPSQESLVVEARIRPIDIDDVGPDQSARVRLLAYNYRNVEPLIARIETVSADLVVDQRSGDGYYLVRLEILPDSTRPASAVAKPGARQSIHLAAGMPVEVMIATRPNSIIRYMLAPITDVFRRSLRES